MARATTGVLAVLALLAVPPSASAERCAGEKVTISFRDEGVGLNILGTGGRDVILGGPESETIQGAGGEDVICGGDGNDRIGGGKGRDELLGEEGVDRFSGPDLGMDIVVGGTGRRIEDRADYGKSPVGIRLNMRNGLVLADGTAVRGGIQGIEEVEATNHDDVLIGDNGSQSLQGTGGNDVIDGREGNDALNGGRGIDTVTYATADAAAVIKLEGTATVGKGRGADTDEVGSFEIVVGSRFDDKISGGDRLDDRVGGIVGEDEQLEGGPGDDVIRAGLGDDVLEGGDGDDTLHPGPGDDVVAGGANGRVTGIGAPGDLVSYQGDTPTDDLGASSFKFEARLAPSGVFGDVPPQSKGVGTDLFSGIESIRGPQKSGFNLIQGDDGPNVLIGGSKLDAFDAGGGNDLVFALGGEDSLHGEAGDDFLDGGTPDGETDTDSINGGEGADTCLGADQPGYQTDCETTAK